MSFLRGSFVLSGHQECTAVFFFFKQRLANSKADDGSSETAFESFAAPVKQVLKFSL